MAKTQKFNENLLLEAVVAYSDIYKGDIKATELAKWARENIVGLEEVKYYHFTRPIQEKNPRTGKVKEKEKLCKKRIDEINQARSVAKYKTNPILSSCNIDNFFELPIPAQRNVIVETRQKINELYKSKAYYQKQFNVFKAENEELKREVEELVPFVKKYKKKQLELEKQVKHLMTVMNEEQMKEALAEIGITDNKFKRSVFNNSKDMTDFTDGIDDIINKYTDYDPDEIMKHFFDDIK